MTPADVLPSLIELSIAIAGFSAVVVAIQERARADAQVRIYLNSLLLSTFNACALSVGAMVLLASPLDDVAAWSGISLAHALVAIGVLVVRERQRRLGSFVRTRPLRLARIVLYAVSAIQLANVIVVQEPWRGRPEGHPTRDGNRRAFVSDRRRAADGDARATAQAKNRPDRRAGRLHPDIGSLVST